jgi:hypothetical protein
MTTDVRKRGVELAKLLSNLSYEEWKSGNESARKTESEQHKAFQEKFKAGECSFCGDALTSFDVTKPCRHWLLKPEGFRKNNFELLATTHSWSTLENYLRWVANEGAYARNINDLKDEGTGKLVEVSMRYKNLAWSFSCGVGDLSGHQTAGEQSRQPHYHFMMSVDGKSFIRYNDFHSPLSTEDVGLLEYIRTNPNATKRVAGGEGMSELLNESTLEHLLTIGRSAITEEEVETGPVAFSNFIQAKPGKTIKGEDIQALVRAANAQGVTATSKIRELKDDVTIHTFVSAGPGVVQQATRSGKKKKRRKGNG